MAAVRAIGGVYGTLDRWPVRPDYLDHERATGTLLVAERDGEIVGFGGALARGGVTHLADLFLAPQERGRGIGAALLDRLLPEGGERVTFASSDPRAVPLYRRYGMRPVCTLPCLRGGRPAAARLARTALTAEPAGPDRIASLDALPAGRSRTEDHEFLAGLSGANGLLLRHGDEVVGYGYVRVTDGDRDGERIACIGPAGSLRDDHAVDCVTTLVSAGAAIADEVELALLDSHPALPRLLDAGFQVTDTDTLMASRPDVLDGHKYAPSHELG
jgi:GNAT superfamily N-acetyltransferase